MKPLTWDEVTRSRIGKPVYMHQLTTIGSSGWRIVYPTTSRDTLISIGGRGEVVSRDDEEDYGVMFKCYDRDPNKTMTNFDKITANPKALAEFLDKGLNQDRADWSGIGCFGCDNYGTHHADSSAIGTQYEYLYECGDCEFKDGLLAWLNQPAPEVNP